MRTLAIGLGRVRFIKPLDPSSQPRCFFFEIAGELPMRPLADPFGMAEVHNLARRLMQNVTLLPIKFGANLRLMFKQPLGVSRPRLTAAESFL